jgi:hypothetical protein
MSLDKTTASGVLKEFYIPTVNDQLVNKNEYLAQLEKNTEDVEGTEAVLSLHVGRNQGIGARKELEDLPAPGNQAYVKARVNLKYNYGQIQVSGPVMRAMKSDNGSWLRALESETKGIVADLKRDTERQLLSTSDGVIAATGVTTADTDVVHSATKTQRLHLKVGMLIDIGTVASPTAVASARTITAIVSDTVFTISGAAVTTATTDRIFRAGSGGSGANQREITGLQTIVDSTGSLFGVDPATYPEWVSYEKDASSAAISDALIEELIDEVDIVSPLGVPDWAITDHRQARVYAATLADQRRFTSDGELFGGFKGLEVGTASGTLVLSTLRDAPVQTLFAVNRSALTEYKASDWEFMEEDGNVLQRIVTGNGKDGYGATLFKYSEQATSYRNAHGKIVNLAA